MIVPQLKRRKLYMTLMIIGASLLIVGLPLCVFAGDIFGGKIPAERTWEENVLIGGVDNRSIHLDPWGTYTLYDTGMILASGKGSRWTGHVYEVTNGTIDFEIRGYYNTTAYDLLYEVNDTTNAYFDVIIPEDYLDVVMPFFNSDLLFEKDFKLFAEVYAPIHMTNSDEVWKARNERSRIEGVYAPIFLIVSFVGFFMLLAGVGGWLQARRKIPQAVYPSAPSYQPVPPQQPTPAPVSPAPTLKCPQCGADVQPMWKACPSCCNKLPLLCSHCRAVVQEGWKACPNCGGKI